MVSATNLSAEGLRGTLIASLRDASGELVSELQSQPLSIAAGNSLNTFQITWQREAQYGQSPTAASFAQLGRVGYGVYTLCFVFIDEQQTQLGQHCSEKTSTPAASFQLIFPFDRSTLDETRPVLSWEAATGFVPQIQALRYALRLVAVEEGQSASEALEVNVPLLERTALTTNSLLYPLDARPLRNGETYAWSVDVYLEGAVVTTSEQWQFSVRLPKAMKEVPEALSYVMVDTKITNRFVTISDAICVGFDNNEGVNSLNYRIRALNATEDEVGNLPVVDGLEAGLNTIQIPTDDLRLKESELYQLEIFTPRGVTYYLQFQYRS